MTQHDFSIANAVGAAARADINGALQALANLSAETTAPSTTYPNMLWADTANNLLKKRNNANNAWITLGDLDTAYLGLLVNAAAAITGQTAETAPATDDLLLISDTSASAALRKMTVANLLKAVNGLTADSSPDQAADYILTYDASANAAKKVLLATLGGLPALSSGLALLASATASASSSIDFTSLLGSTYDEYLLLASDVRPSANNVFMYLQVSNDNGATWKTTGYDGSHTMLTAAGGQQVENATTGITLLQNLEASAGYASRAQVWFGGVNDSGDRVPFFVQSMQYDRAEGYAPGIGGGGWGTVGAINAIRVVPGSGTITTGTFRLYGVKK